MSERWTKLPTPSSRWDALEYDPRALGTQMYLAYGEGVLDLGPDWRVAIARRLAVSGRARPRLYRDIDAIIDAGLIVVSETTVEFFYSRRPPASDRALNRRSLRTQPTVTAHSTDGEPTVNGQSLDSEPTVNGRSLDTQPDATARNHSTHPPIEEREKRERRETRAPDPEPPPGFDARSERQIGFDLSQALAHAYERKHLERLTVAPSWSDSARKHLATFVRWTAKTAEQRRQDPVVLGSGVITAFFADEKLAPKRWPTGFLAHDPGQWLEAAAALVTSPLGELKEQLHEANLRGDLDAQDRLRSQIRALSDAARRGEA